MNWRDVCSDIMKQECIPVGCVPAARWPYARVCFPPPGGVLSPGGGLLPGGVCVCSWGCMLGGCLLQGVSALGGCLLWGMSAPGGWCLLWGGGIPACTEADTPLWTEWMTDRCKNITLTTTSLRPVINTRDSESTYILRSASRWWRNWWKGGILTP